jgi:Transcription initiation factor TFIID component TAF4 family
MDEEQPPSAAHQIVSVFQKVSNANRASEQARLAKRAKRGVTNPTQVGTPSGAATPSDVQTPVIAPAEPPKRLTKKDKKAAESKMSDAQQQKSANETARMAMGLGLGGSNKFKKSYSWLHGGAASLAASVGQKANTGNEKATTSNAGLNSTSSAYGSARTGPSIGRGKRLGEWDESDDGAIQARDVLLVLETDGQAVKALSRGYNTPERAENR